MPKLIASINQTLDGNCDHTQGIADGELHDHYTALLRTGSAVLYGRITYQLMEDYWPTLVANPSGEPHLDDFAHALDDLQKIVFSTTLPSVSWRNSELKRELVKEEIQALVEQSPKDVFVGSPSMIVALTNLGLIDEYQLCMHPVISTGGLPLFNQVRDRHVLNLTGTKTFGSGAIVLTYSVTR